MDRQGARDRAAHVRGEKNFPLGHARVIAVVGPFLTDRRQRRPSGFVRIAWSVPRATFTSRRGVQRQRTCHAGWSRSRAASEAATNSRGQLRTGRGRGICRSKERPESDARRRRRRLQGTRDDVRVRAASGTRNPPSAFPTFRIMRARCLSRARSRSRPPSGSRRSDVSGACRNARRRRRGPRPCRLPVGERIDPACSRWDRTAL